MEDMMSQSGISYSPYNGFLTGLLVLLIKFLFLILIISIIIGVVLWIKNNFFKNMNITQLINQSPATKSIAGIIVAILILFLLMFLLSFLTGRSYNYSMGNMSGTYSVGTSFGLTGIIIFLFKALTFFFAITLIISLVAYMIKQFGIKDLHLFQSTNKSFGDSASPNMDQYNSYSSIPKPADEQDNDNI